MSKKNNGLQGVSSRSTKLFFRHITLITTFGKLYQLQVIELNILWVDTPNLHVKQISKFLDMNL